MKAKRSGGERSGVRRLAPLALAVVAASVLALVGAWAWARLHPGPNAGPEAAVAAGRADAIMRRTEVAFADAQSFWRRAAADGSGGRYDPARITYARLLECFWEAHDPTQGMRQGNDVGTQYRSGIYCADEAQLAAARASLARYQVSLRAAGYGAITTEILPAPAFYYAEEYHQQYLAKNPGGYCGLGGTGVRCAADSGA